MHPRELAKKTLKLQFVAKLNPTAQAEAQLADQFGILRQYIDDCLRPDHAKCDRHLLTSDTMALAQLINLLEQQLPPIEDHLGPKRIQRIQATKQRLAIVEASIRETESALKTDMTQLNMRERRKSAMRRNQKTT